MSTELCDAWQFRSVQLNCFGSTLPCVNRQACGQGQWSRPSMEFKNRCSRSVRRVLVCTRSILHRCKLLMPKDLHQARPLRNGKGIKDEGFKLYTLHVQCVLGQAAVYICKRLRLQVTDTPDQGLKSPFRIQGQARARISRIPEIGAGRAPGQLHQCTTSASGQPGTRVTRPQVMDRYVKTADEAT